MHSLKALRADTEQTVVCMGVFDGVHRGHASILDTSRRIARARGMRWMVITFDRHPCEIIAPEKTPRMIASRDQTIALIKEYAPDGLAVLPFTPELASQTADQFLALLQGELGMAELVIGDTFSMGRGAVGTKPWLIGRAAGGGFALHVAPPARHGDALVSSSRIRRAIESGALDQAADMLGHEIPEITGRVEQGRHLGRDLGAPTLNIALPPGRILPPDGVYAARVSIEGHAARFDAVLNLGIKPTLGDNRRTLEAHLLGVSGSFYGEIASVQWHAYLRPEKRFDDLDALARAIQTDICDAQKILKGTRTKS